jgi:hypothetical protein
MSKNLLNRIFLIALTFLISIKCHSNSDIGKSLDDNFEIRIGFDCDRDTSSVTIVTQVHNLGGSSIYFYSSQLGLDRYPRNGYSFIPIEHLKDKNKWQYELRYRGIQDVSMSNSKNLQSTYELTTADYLILSDYINRSYGIDVGVSYRVEMPISYIDKNRSLHSWMVGFTYDPVCFKSESVYWVKNIDVVYSKVVKPF